MARRKKIYEGKAKILYEDCGYVEDMPDKEDK